MAEKNINPLAEPLEKSAQAAHLINGAVKTGKAIAGAAKGAAAGGPYGAAIGFVWENRQLVGKVIIATVALLMLPVIILCMLPSVMFGGFDEAYAPDDPDNPILNSSTVIVDTANTICQSVDAILSDALRKVVQAIEKDFEKSTADQIDIINPYAGSIAFDAATLVSMYCASKDGDYTAVSVEELETLLRKHMDKLFTYDFKEETREAIVTDSDTGEDAVAEEVWRIYTVTYHGESVFTQQVFSLTEDQKALAKDYASNLNLFLMDKRFVDSVPSAFQKNVHIDITGYHDPTTKNNLDLVVWAIEAERNRWGYVWGTFGDVLDSSLYAYKLKQYPTEVGRYSAFITSNWLGGRTADCVGLIKGYSWLDIETLEVGYKTNGMPDIGADTMYHNATEKGAISTIPEIPGLAVWHTGHIGIYIGNGEVIEAMGTRYGVVRTKLVGSRWTHWLKIPYITYQ